MGKIKKLSRILPSKKNTVNAAEVEGNSDDDIDYPQTNVISASEDEDGSGDERKHSKLLEAISALGGKRRKVAERSEASLQVSEFGVNAEGAGAKVALSDLLSLAGEASKKDGNLTKTRKQLNNLERSHATLDLPLSQQQTEKIQREVAFEKAAKEVSQWQTTVNHQQRAEQLIFPLNQPSAAPKRMEQLVTSWKTETPLEQEVFAVLHAHRQPMVDPVLTPVEEAQLQAMSLEEAQIRRAELQKARALQSYYEAKAKREHRIKSKKYHKVQQKAKRKAFLKEFDELCKSNPEKALKELQKMEKNRIEERMSLKHQNTGKWAKSRAIMAKYDLTARQAMQEQLELNRQLTHKPLPSADLHDDSDHEEIPNQDAGVEETLPDIVNDATANQKEGANPWMRMTVVMPPAQGEHTTARNESELPQSGVQEEIQLAKEMEEDEEEETEEEKLLGEFARRRLQRKANDEDVEEATEVTEILHATAVDEVSTTLANGKNIELEKEGDEEEEEEEKEGEKRSSEDEEDQMDEAAASELSALFGRLAKQGRQNVAPTATTDPSYEPTLLDEDITRVRTIEDVEQLADAQSDTIPVVDSIDAKFQDNSDGKGTKVTRKQRVIDLKQVLTKQANNISVPIATYAVEDAEDEALDEQTSVIREAFAGDDVISDFLKEKRKQELEGQPKHVDLSLPGWGEWGGTGIKISRKKRRRFLKKAPPPAPRKDRKLPSVIISEKRNASVAAHQVSQLPFPFKNPGQFEQTIRSPLGSTWNPELVVGKLTAPRIVTKAGAIIEPMSKEDILPRNGAPAKRGAPDIKLDQTERRKGHSNSGAKRKKHKK